LISTDTLLRAPPSVAPATDEVFDVFAAYPQVTQAVVVEGPQIVDRTARSKLSGKGTEGHRKISVQKGQREATSTP
jgi:hypothetical protein